MAITDKDIKRIGEQLEERFRGAFATKDDLTRFATKDDLARFATKDDLTRFATKDDLEALDNRILLRNYATKDDLTELGRDLRNEILNSQDKIMKRMDDWRTEEKSWHLQIQRNEGGVKECKVRLGILEANRLN